MSKLQIVRAWEGKALGTTKPRDPAEAVGLVRAQLRGLGPFRIKRDDQAPWSHDRQLKATIDRLEDLVPRLELGEVLRIKALGAPDERDVMRLALADVEPDVNLPAAADRWHPLVRQAYTIGFGSDWKNGRPYFLGAEVCRPTRHDPSQWSMHSYWPPCLAVDIGVATKALGDEINRKLEQELDGIVTVWWTTAHFDHIHAQAGPNRSGRPICA